MAEKKVIGNLKLRIPAGRATAGPPVGSTLGQWGLNMMDFINPFNEATKDLMGKNVIVHIRVFEDRTFDWKSLGQPVDDMIREAIKIQKGSGKPNVDKVGKITKAQLKDMGFSAEQATSFLGKLELAGVDADTVMQGLKKAFTNSAKEGKNTKEALAELQEALTSTKSDTEKTVDAIDLFGNRAGPAIAEACKSGRLNFEDLGKAMTDYEGNLDKTYDATLDASDKITLTFHLRLINLILYFYDYTVVLLFYQTQTFSQNMNSYLRFRNNTTHIFR